MLSGSVQPVALASQPTHSVGFANVRALTANSNVLSTVHSNSDAQTYNKSVQERLENETPRNTSYSLQTVYKTTAGVEADSMEDVEDEELLELQTDYERRKAEREKEQDLAAAERHRLEEILRICSEYDQEFGKVKTLPPTNTEERRDDSRSSWGSNSKIKTNGSLVTSAAVHNRPPDDVDLSCADDETNLIDHGLKSNAQNSIRPDRTGSDRKQVDKFAQNVKLRPGDDAREALQLGSPAAAKEPDRNGEFQLSIKDLLAEIDDDNISTDCFLEDTTSVASNDPSELSFQTPVVYLKGQQYKPNGSKKYIRAPETVPRRLDLERSYTGFSRPIGHQRKQTRDQKSKEGSERVRILRQRIVDIKSIEEKTVGETQAELELIQWDYNTLIEQLRREKDRIAAINHQQMELLFEAAKEREEAERQIDSERRKLEEVEIRLEETERRCRSLGIDPDHNEKIKDTALGELIINEREEVDQQRRLFEDLEFHLLEMETRREEDREPQQKKLTAELNQLTHSCCMVQETLVQLADQRSALIGQVKSDVIDLEKERLLLLQDFRKEKKKLSSTPNESHGESSSNIPSSLGASHALAPPYNSKITPYTSHQAVKKDGHLTVNDEERECEDFVDSLPRTPSSTTSVIQRLQELDLVLHKSIENAKQMGYEDCGGADEGDEEGDGSMDQDDNSFISSSLSIDRLKSWLEAEHEEEEEEENTVSPDVKFLCGSEGARTSLSNRDEDMERVNRSIQKQADSAYREIDGYSLGTTDDQPIQTERLQLETYQQLINHSRRTYDQSAKRWSRDVPGPNETRHPPPTGEAEVGVISMRPNPRRQSRPMTRYLPVRGPGNNLDLRSFIESSGHRLDTNTHVQMNCHSCRGFLVKMGGKGLRLWHRRWFVFDRTRRSLAYYADQTETRLRGCVLFGAIEDVFVDHMRTVRSPNPRLTFCLKTSVKNFYLVAPSPEAMRIWIDVFFTGAEGYQEFS